MCRTALLKPNKSDFVVPHHYAPNMPSIVSFLCSHARRPGRLISPRLSSFMLSPVQHRTALPRRQQLCNECKTPKCLSDTQCTAPVFRQRVSCREQGHCTAPTRCTALTAHCALVTESLHCGTSHCDTLHCGTPIVALCIVTHRTVTPFTVASHQCRPVDRLTKQAAVWSTGKLAHWRPGGPEGPDNRLFGQLVNRAAVNRPGPCPSPWDRH